jgi:hypothetical protein
MFAQQDYHQPLNHNLSQLIFSFLDPKDEANARLVCKNWEFVCNESRKLLIAWFDSNGTWNSNPEEFFRRLFSRPTHFSRMLDHLNPLALPKEIYSLRGTIVDKIKLTPEERILQFYEVLQEVDQKAPAAKAGEIDRWEFSNKIFFMKTNLESIMFAVNTFDKNELQKLINYATNILGYIDETNGRPDSIDFLNDPLLMTRINKKLELQKKLKEVMIRTGKTLGFLGNSVNDHEQNPPFNYKNLMCVIKDPKSHSDLHRYLKPLWLLSQCQDGEENLEKNCLMTFSTTLSDLFPKSNNISKEKSIFKKTVEVSKEYQWLLNQPYWPAYIDDIDTWYDGFKFYDQLSLTNPPLDEAEKIYALFCHIFADQEIPYKKGHFENMRIVLHEFYDLKDNYEKQICLYKDIPSPTIDESLRWAEAYIEADKHDEAIDLFDAILKIPEEKKLKVLEKHGTFRLYILQKQLKAILKSTNYLKHKEKAYGILKELLQATENTRKLQIKVLIETDEGLRNKEFICDTHIRKSKVLFYQNCLKYLFEKESIINCLKSTKSDEISEIVFGMVKNTDLKQFNLEELKMLKNFSIKQLETLFSTVKKCEGELRTLVLYHFR